MWFLLQNFLNIDGKTLFLSKYFPPISAGPPNLTDSKIEYEKFGIQIDIISFIENVRIESRISPAEPIYKGFLNEFVLLPKHPEKEATQNRPGIIIKLSGLSSEEDGIYGIFLGQRKPDTFQINENLFFTEFRRKRTYLPFSINLLDFEKVMHPGTNVAKSYSSEVNLIEDSMPRRILIQMNVRNVGSLWSQDSAHVVGVVTSVVTSGCRNDPDYRFRTSWKRYKHTGSWTYPTLWMDCT